MKLKTKLMQAIMVCSLLLYTSSINLETAQASGGEIVVNSYENRECQKEWAKIER